MLQTIVITEKDILDRIKLTSKVPEVIEQIIACKIITDTAKDAGIKVETEELQQAADQIRLANKLESVEETWQWLEKHGLSLDDFEKMISDTLLYTKVAQHLFSHQVERYFFEHQLDYSGAFISEIILEDKDLALELFYAIQENEMTFYDAAHQYIQDIELRRKGGYQGMVRRQDLKSEISAAVFAAKPPQLLKPIVTAKGVHLIFVAEIVSPQLNHSLRYQILLNLFSEWLQQQSQQYKPTLILNS